jgi:hypothetical protein
MNPWLVYAAATATTSVFFLLIAGGIARRRRQAPAVRPHIERMTCPKTGADVHVTFLRDMTTGKALDVDGCSAFVFDDDVRCDKACLKVLNNEAAER